MDEREQKQLLMDLEVVMKSNECPCIVQFYGALFKEVYNSMTSLVKITKTIALSYLIILHTGRLLDLHGTYGYVVR